MGWWGNAQLAYKYTIVLVVLIAVTFCAGIIKLYYTRRRVAKAQKKLDLEAAEKDNDAQATNQRELDEGDLFGVRAIESGYFGGVSQSRPTSAVNSPQIGPVTKGLESPSVISISSASSSNPDLSLANAQLSKNPSSLTLDKQPRQSMPVKKLRPSEAQLTGRRNHAAVDVDMNAEMPPSPIAFKTPDLPMPVRLPGQNTWSMSSGSSNSAPIIILPEGDDIDHDFSKMPAASLKHLSNAESMDVEIGSPTRSVFPPTVPKKAAQRQSRAPFTGNVEEDEAYIQSKQRDTLQVSTEDRYKKVMTVELSHLSGISQWGEKVLADLAGEDSPPSTPQANQFSRSRELDEVKQIEIEEPTPEQPKQAMAAITMLPAQKATHTKNAPSDSSSIYSTTQETQGKPQKTESHVRSASRESGKSIKRTQDSLKHTRKQSREELPQQKRRSLERDQIHYDPRPAARTRSGSVVGRTVDFDHPRDSPFSKPPPVPSAIITSGPKAKTALPSHAYNSSISSHEDSDFDISPTHSAKSSSSSISIPVSRFAIQSKESAATAHPAPTIKYPPGRPRSASNTSQASISDVYESYYRKSIMARQEDMDATNDAPGNGKLENGSLMPGYKRSVNLAVSKNANLSMYGGVETIEEVETPMASPALPMERYPRMA